MASSASVSNTSLPRTARLPQGVGLVLYDLDGTAIDAHGRMSARLKSVLATLRHRGVHVCPCSSRSYGFMPRSVRSLKANDYLICTNGALALRRRDERALVEHALDREVIASIMERLSSFFLAWNALLYDGKWFEPLGTFFFYHGEPMPRRIARYVRRAIFPEEGTHPVLSVVRLLAEWNEPVYQLECVCRSREERDRVFTILAQRNDISASRMEDVVIQISPRGTSKGSTARELQRLLGVTSEQTVAFGDGLNDLPLAQASGTFVAMGNADPELKRQATEVTGTVDEDGMAAWLERLLKEDEALHG